MRESDPPEIPWRAVWAPTARTPNFPFATPLLMPTAIILLKIDHKRVTGTAEKLLDIPAVTDVYSVSGRFDLLVIIKCESVDLIECVITDELLKIDGITESETMFAFRSYDKREGGKAIDVD